MGTYWVCFTMNDLSVIEYSLNDYAIIENTKAFVTRVLLNVELDVGERALI